MKIRFFAVAAALVLAVLSSGSVVHAQELLVVKVPFDFIAAGATLPAGEYTVQPLSHGPVVMLHKIGAPSAAAMAMTNPGQPKKERAESVLVFNRHGEDYFLSEIWYAQDQICRELTFKPSHARDVQLAKSDMPDQITLVGYSAPAK